MPNRTNIQRRYLSVISAVILIANLVMPTGWVIPPRVAQAADPSYDWTFANADAANYTLDAGLMLANDTLHFKIQDFSSSGLGAGIDAIPDPLSDILYDSGGKMWGLINNGVFISTDNGVNWGAFANPTLSAMTVYDIIEIDYADGTPGANLIAAGKMTAELLAPATAYSFDGGTTWSPGGSPIILGSDRWLALSYDTTNDVVYATGNSGTARISSVDGGEHWTNISPVASDMTPSDIVAFGADSVAVIGNNGGGNGLVEFTTDGGTTWTPMTLATELVSAAYIGGVVYAMGTNYLIKNDIAGGGTMDDAGDWINISANLNSGVFSSSKFMIGGINSNIVFLAVRAGGSYQLYSSVDEGVNFNLHYADPNSTFMSGGIAFNPTGSALFWSGLSDDDGSVHADVYSATVTPANTSVITLAGPTDVGTILSITATANGLNYGEAKVSFGQTATDAGTWWYYDGTWKSSTADDSTKATTVSTLTPEVLAGMALTGTIYVKIYPPDTSSTLVLDNLNITYNQPAGGQGDPDGDDPTDKTPPISQVNPLPRYSTAADVCNPVLRVTATAFDETQLYAVTLYVSNNGNDFAPWNGDGTDYYAPYEWDVSVTNGQNYYFYTIASDNGNPRNYEAPPNSPDTMTTIDVSAPTVNSSTPQDRDVDVGVSQSIVFVFSESLIPETFTYEFYQKTAQGNAPVTGANLTWANNYTKITVTHPTLEYSADYVFNITNATDAAGNQLNNTRYCPPPDCDNPGGYNPGRFGPPQPGCGGRIPQPPPPKLIQFTTRAGAMNPDLFDSTLTVPDGSNADGSYNAGDEAQFTITLLNNSSTPADNVLVRIGSFPSGVSYSKTDENGGGNVKEYKENGRVVKWEWRNTNPIIKNQSVEIKFTVKVDSPYLDESFAGALQANIYDNVNFTEEPDMPMSKQAEFEIAHNAVLTSSTITASPDPVRVGDIVTYNVEIYNTGTTIGDIEFNDFIPSWSNEDGEPPIFYSSGSLTWDKRDTRWEVAPSYDEITQIIQGKLNNLAPNSPKAVLEFKAVIRDSVVPPVDVTNTAYVWDNNELSPEQIELSATVLVEEGPPIDPIQINYQKPEPDSNNNPLLQPIEVGFSRSVVVDDFLYELAEDGRTLSEDELANWTIAWDDFNGSPNALLTLTPPSDGMWVGAIYTMTIVAVSDEDGNQPEELPIAWSFTTADPMVTITKPTDPLYELMINTLSDEFEVTLVDSISGELYKAEWNVGIGLQAYLASKVRESGLFWSSPTRPLSPNSQKITISKGASKAVFYYQDSETSGGDYVTIRAFENPYFGWADAEQYVVVVDTEQPAESLVIDTPDTVEVGQFSQPITVYATNANGGLRYLPEGRLYLYTDSTAGAFYDNFNRKLKSFSGGDVTIQDLAPQYIDIGANKGSVTLYYLNPEAGIDQITISDNNPEIPDIGLNDAGALLSIEEIIKEEEIEEELEEVEDDTGRVIETIEIDPTEITLLPEGKTDFSAKAYDVDGEEIDGLKFGWFVLLQKSGTIEKRGHGDSSTSTFTAGTTLGTYPDTILVAAMYNDKLAYATATVKIVDVVNYKGPKRLPVTGMNGLQLILMGLTLMAAVALAWVEHYDKTHFKPESNE